MSSGFQGARVSNSGFCRARVVVFSRVYWWEILLANSSRNEGDLRLDHCPNSNKEGLFYFEYVVCQQCSHTTLDKA